MGPRTQGNHSIPVQALGQLLPSGSNRVPSVMLEKAGQCSKGIQAQLWVLALPAGHFTSQHQGPRQQTGSGRQIPASSPTSP